MPRSTPSPKSLTVDSRVAVPIGAFYVMLFLQRGAASPFFPLWLQGRGYSSDEISALLAISALGGVVAAPGVALLCSRFSHKRTGLAATALAAAACFAVLSLLTSAGSSTAVVPIIWVCAAMLAQAQLPLIDVVAVSAAAYSAPHYGRYRGIGTAAYLVACMLAGSIFGVGSAAALPVWCALTSTGGAFAALLIPKREWNWVQSARRGFDWRACFSLLRSPSFLALLLVAGLIECSHVYFFSFSSLIWQADGLSPLSIGFLRAVGAVCEVVFLVLLEPWCRRTAPWTLLMIASGASLVRWLAMGLGLPLWLELMVQSLHALSFTVTFIATLRFIEKTQSAAVFAFGQSVCTAFVCGVVPGVATFFCGALFAHHGASGYFLMAGVASIAAIAGFFSRSLLSIPNAGDDPPHQRIRVASVVNVSAR